MDWHERFVQQATWTRDLRHYLFERCGLKSAQKVLDVGCGTGAILSMLNTAAQVHGIDLLRPRLEQARRNMQGANLLVADAQYLPYASAEFDITFCHFFLLWAKDPLQCLLEMKRVTRGGGHILALAEPDYSARVDEPDELAILGRWQSESLASQGADTQIGSKLKRLFDQASIPVVETGKLDQGRSNSRSSEEWNLEWKVLEADLEGMHPAAEIQRLKRQDRDAWKSGRRILYVPTYFAWGHLSQMV